MRTENNNKCVFEYFSNIRYGVKQEALTLEELLYCDVGPVKGPLKDVLLEGLEKTEIAGKPCLAKVLSINPIYFFEEDGTAIIDYIMFGCIRGFIEQMRYDRLTFDLNDEEHNEPMELLNKIVFNTLKANFKFKDFESTYKDHLNFKSSTIFTIIREDVFDPLAPVYFMCRISEESRLN